MIRSILTATAIYGVRDHADLIRRQARAVAKHPGATIETDSAPRQARIDHGRWLLDCDCGSGVGCDPTWPDARCFGCGTVYPTVVYPASRARIEAALLKRVKVEVRNWALHETAADLEAENDARGLR